MKRLYRSTRNRVIAGVCGGVGEYFSVDPVIVRIVAVVLFFMGGSGLLAYIIAAIIIPNEPQIIPDIQAPVPESTSSISAPSHSAGQGALFVGVLLTVLGVMFLLRNFSFLFPGFYWFHHYVWHNFWPGLLIALGLFLILRRNK